MNQSLVQVSVKYADVCVQKKFMIPPPTHAHAHTHTHTHTHNTQHTHTHTQLCVRPPSPTTSDLRSTQFWSVLWSGEVYVSSCTIAVGWRCSAMSAIFASFLWPPGGFSLSWIILRSSPHHQWLCSPLGLGTTCRECWDGSGTCCVCLSVSL